MLNYDDTNYKKIIKQLSSLKISTNSINKILYGYWQRTDVYRLLKKEEEIILNESSEHTREFNKQRHLEWFKKYRNALETFINNIKNSSGVDDDLKNINFQSLNKIISREINQLEKGNKPTPIYNNEIPVNKPKIQVEKKPEENIKTDNLKPIDISEVYEREYKERLEKEEEIKQLSKKPKKIHKHKKHISDKKQKQLSKNKSIDKEKQFLKYVEENNIELEELDLRNIEKTEENQKMSEYEQIDMDEIDNSLIKDKIDQKKYNDELNKRKKEIEITKEEINEKTPNFIKQIQKIKREKISLLDLSLSENENFIVHKKPDEIIIEIFDTKKEKEIINLINSLSDKEEKADFPIPVKIVRIVKNKKFK